MLVAKQTQEEKIAKWRKTKQAEWNTGGKLKERFPTQVGLDRWMDQQVDKAERKKVNTFFLFLPVSQDRI